MKKVFILLAVGLTLFACNTKNQQDKKEKKTVDVPSEIPVAPTSQVPPQTNTQSLANTPMLKLEEGKPLDLSQLMGKQRKTFGEVVAEQIDSIRYKAEKGNADYEYLYAACLENGWGVDANALQALTWYKKAADQKQKASYNAIGNIYRLGLGIKPNEKEAFRWFQMGAEANDAEAMLNLGNCYYFGMGTKKNVTQAVQWWQQSANNSNAFALAQMGDCYLYGIGVEKDLEKAVNYLTQAADHNVEGAQYRLGILYYTGQGVKQDLAYSKLLMSKARDGGMKEAQEFLDKNFK